MAATTTMNITATSKIAVSKTVVTGLTVLPRPRWWPTSAAFRHRPTGGPGAECSALAVQLSSDRQPRQRVRVTDESWLRAGPPPRRAGRGDRVVAPAGLPRRGAMAAH